ncbi:MAG: helix-turn-helix domain-containing protein [Caulobacteraceae bacterium]|nr:helix-turn-helix domain-containing protein [Caulobacteraceae bacterium]
MSSEREDGPSLDSGRNIGEALRLIREFHGLGVDAIADITRVRASYLIAIEEMRLAVLPSRPFTIGYVRAYAQALQCDPDAAVARFRRDVPEDDQGLRAPVGVRRERDPRMTLFMIAGAVVVIGVGLWNISRHAIADQASRAESSQIVPPPPRPAVHTAAAAGPSAPLPLGAPLPAPQESTTPTPYVTPGLEAETGGGPVLSGAAAEDPAAEGASPTPVPFVADGAVYGAAAAQSTITLQAARPGTLVIHGADGTVYFAKELAKGEAYRVPEVAGLSVDVSDPLAFNVFVGGMLKGALPAAQAPISRLTE